MRESKRVVRFEQERLVEILHGAVVIFKIDPGNASVVVKLGDPRRDGDGPIVVVQRQLILFVREVGRTPRPVRVGVMVSSQVSDGKQRGAAVMDPSRCS